MKVLLSNQVRAAEDIAVKNGNFSYADLMLSAGNTATKVITNRFNVVGKNILIICGCGNNGGDGLVIASNLKKQGAQVSLLAPIGFPSTDTALLFKEGVADIKLLNDFTGDFDIIIDALFGIGLNRFLSEKLSELIRKINEYNCTKIAIDIPSGLFCDGGEVLCAFRADLTLTFSCYKLCQLLPQTSEYCGETVVLDIGLPISDYAYLTIDKPQKVKRPRISHKGTFGTALLICGSYGMCGAQILSARAALRSGVGILKALVCDKNYSAFTAAVPEAVTIPTQTTECGAIEIYDHVLINAIASSTALLVGCGLGRNEYAKNLIIRSLKQTQIPVVIDADGINALQGCIDIIRKINAPVILTPHPAEMARLCNTTTEKIEAGRVKYAKKFAVENNCYLLLKGAHTIVATPNGRIFFNTTGNDALATGGSGDVLSGMIVSRLAQGYAPLDAVLNSVWLHGAVADELSKTIPTRAILPTDIIEGLKTISD